jgi:alpha-L-rhamnosidase
MMANRKSDTAEWQPAFISAEGAHGTDVWRARVEFTLDGAVSDVASAVLKSTALGIIDTRMNGTATSDEVLVPGWTSYEWRLRYAEHDVRAHLGSRNAIALTVAPGWFAGRIGWSGRRGIYGDTTAAAVHLDIVFTDGRRQVIQSSASWACAPSDTTSADLYDGQRIDARLRTNGWDSPGFDDAGWSRCITSPTPTAALEPSSAPPVQRHETVAAQRIWRSPQGQLLIDFGQNLVGWLRMTVQGPAGRHIQLRHAEVLENDELGVRPLRSAQATDVFVTSGEIDQFEPTYTVHGFRYVEVSGWPGTEAELADAVRAVVVHTRLRRTGTFRCSSPLISKLHENIVWGFRGNAVSVPTDCPQRDERLGWTGDIAVFAPTAAYLFDVGDFLGDWMKDLRLEQSHANGIVPFVVPDPLKYGEASASDITTGPRATPTAFWSDAAVWVPWALYRSSGNAESLRAQWEAMSEHGRAVERVLAADGVWDSGFQFGDWLDPAAPPEDPFAATTPTDLVATASAYRTFDLLSQAAAIVGRQGEAEDFRDLAARVRTGFRGRYLLDGSVAPATATALALTICFGLVDSQEADRLGTVLARVLADQGHLIATGFAGTPFVTEALTNTGQVETAYRLLQQQNCPSWLYPVTMGATTVWERWDSMLPDGTINPGEMTSFNHFALGAVADWMHRVVGGIAPLDPGYRTVLIAPLPGGDLTWCETSLDSAAGKIAVRWEKEGDAFTYTVDIPTGVEATVRLPGQTDIIVGSGRHLFEQRREPGN